MIRRPPRSTQSRSSAASDVYKRQFPAMLTSGEIILPPDKAAQFADEIVNKKKKEKEAALKIPKTVSYTHLRAHETVLDLVCRLLLEKKKNQLINSS